MGNRAHLFLGDYCEFEANNCLPVTWLALFEPQDFLVERWFEKPTEREQSDKPDKKPQGFRKLLSTMKRFLTNSTAKKQQSESAKEYVAAGYRTSQPTALHRVESTIERLRGHTPVWAYLRPLEILEDELKRCPPDDPINLDLTQLWAMNETFNQRVKQAVADFGKMLTELSGNVEQDLAVLSQLVDDFTLGRISSVLTLDSEERMFVLIGTYWGDEEREELYSLEYFNDAYWAVK